MDKSRAKKKGQTLAATLLARAHEPSEAERIHTDKVQLRPLFLTPSSPPPDARAARRRARDLKLEKRKKTLKPKPLSSADRRRLGLHDIPRERQHYALYTPLHNLWLGYIREVLGRELFSATGEGAGAKLASADLHGAHVEVVRSGCPSRVGIRGIVVKDSRCSLEIVTEKNALKLVPKEGTVFRFAVPPELPAAATLVSGGTASEAKAATTQDQEVPASMVFEIHGEQFQYRSDDRSNRKFRWHFSKKL